MFLEVFFSMNAFTKIFQQFTSDFGTPDGNDVGFFYFSRFVSSTQFDVPETVLQVKIFQKMNGNTFGNIQTFLIQSKNCFQGIMWTKNWI